METKPLNAVVWEVEPEGGRNALIGPYVKIREAEMLGWENRPKPPLYRVTAPELLPESRQIIASSIADAGPLGRGSIRELHVRLNLAMEWARAHFEESLGPFQPFAEATARVALRRFSLKVPQRLLLLELDDQKVRDGLLTSDVGLSDYLGETRHILSDLQRGSASRHRLGGQRNQELIDETVVRILDLIRNGERPFPFAKYERPGRPAYLQVYEDVRSAARRKLRVALACGSAIFTPPLSPSPEEQLIQAHSSREIASFPERLAPHLSKKQRRWLAVFLELIEREGNLSLSAAASTMGVHKAQAGRVMEKLAAAARRFHLIENLAADLGLADTTANRFGPEGAPTFLIRRRNPRPGPCPDSRSTAFPVRPGATNRSGPR
jgi:hypothetical protein